MVKVKYLMGMALSVALISCGGTGDGFVEEKEKTTAPIRQVTIINRTVRVQRSRIHKLTARLDQTGDGFVEENVEFARKQIGKEIELIEASGKFMNPTTLNPDGSVYYCNLADWRSGFSPVRFGICMS